jgi:hypothetical protein
VKYHFSELVLERRGVDNGSSVGNDWHWEV